MNSEIGSKGVKGPTLNLHTMSIGSDVKDINEQPTA